MKRFLCRLLAFAALFVLLCGMVAAVSAVEPGRSLLTNLADAEDYTSTASDEILPYIARAGEKPQATRLIVGDSVCWQLFDPFEPGNPGYVVAGNNRGAAMSGQYLIAKRFLQAHPGATDIYLVGTPELFSAELDAEYGYQYAVLPFVETGLLGELPPATLARARKNYGGLFLQPAVVKLVNRSPLVKKAYLNWLSATLKTEGSAVSDTTAECLPALQELCRAQGVALHLVCVPTADTEGRRAAVEALRAAAEGALAQPLGDYLASVRYWPSADYGDDETHFSYELATAEFLGGMIAQYQTELGLFPDYVTAP